MVTTTTTSTSTNTTGSSTTASLPVVLPILASPTTTSKTTFNYSDHMRTIDSTAATTTMTTSSSSSSSDVNHLLLLETMNESLRSIVAQYATTTLVHMYTKTHQLQQLTVSLHDTAIPTTIQYIQQCVIPALTTISTTTTTNEDGTSSSNTTAVTNDDIVTATNTTTTPNTSTTSMVQTLNHAIQEHRIRRKTLVQQTSAILELLELPHLMEVCIRSSSVTGVVSVPLLGNPTTETNNNNNNNNSAVATLTNTNYYYDEAIQIATFANTLERRHGSSSSSTSSSSQNDDTDNNIIHQVIQQIRIRQDELRQQLLLRLQSQSHHHHQQQQQSLSISTTTNNTNSSSSTMMMMSDCLEIITALRRLNAIDLERHTTIRQQQQQQQQSGSTSMTKNNIISIEHAHAMSEYQLQIAFLEARDVWLTDNSNNNSSNFITDHHKSHSTAISTMTTTTTTSETILDMIERYRTRMFEIATQYNAIFTATSSSTTTTSSSRTSAITTTTTTPQITSAQQLLSLWITRRIQYFLQLLRQELSIVSLSSTSTTTTDGSSNRSIHNNDTKVDTAMIRDAIEASVFFATSLGRLGGDFTSQLTCIFEPIVIQLITQQYWINDGIQPFRTTLEICRTAGIATPLVSSSSSSVSSSNIESITTAPPDDYNFDDFSLNHLPPLDEPQPPPKRLLTVPPLARFVNAILTGLNELRRCLLPGTFVPLRRFLKENVIDVMIQELELNERAVSTPGLRGDAVALRSIAVLMKSTFETIVTPYILGSLEAAIGYQHGAIQYHTQLYDTIQRLHANTTNSTDDSNEHDVVIEQDADNIVESNEIDISYGDGPKSTDAMENEEGVEDDIGNENDEEETETVVAQQQQ